MSEPRTVIDFWKCDLTNVRPDHLTMATPSGDRTVSTEAFRTGPSGSPRRSPASG